MSKKNIIPQGIEKNSSLTPTTPARQTPLGFTVTGDLGKLSAGPVMPATRTVLLSKQAYERRQPEYSLTLASGLYIITGSRAIGKSTVLAGICAAAVDCGWESVGRLYVHEPNAPDYRDGKGSVVFTDASLFLKGDNGESDFSSYLGANAMLPKPYLRLLGIDSITRAVPAYNVKARVGGGTGEKGIQNESLSFITILNNLCVTANISCLAVINSELLQYADLLGGSCQGEIRPNAYNQFTIVDRPSGRVTAFKQISKDFSPAALTAMGYSADETK